MNFSMLIDMHDLIRIATTATCEFLEKSLPKLSSNWWDEHVIQRLSFHQSRVAEERRFSTLQQFDFAAMLRIVDQNWRELSDCMNLPREGRNWVKELMTIRNKWSHLSTEEMPPSELYRDADTLERFLLMIGSEQVTLDEVERQKDIALASLATKKLDLSAPLPGEGGAPAEASDSPEKAKTSNPLPQRFTPGDMVTLKSNPETDFPVIAVLTGQHETRYRVFQNNAPTTYYESQLQSAPTRDERRILSVGEMQAQLTALHLLSPSTANLFSIRSGRVQFVPYQYRPVLKLIRADRPRLLIADEVGVGKTIEAGLALKELSARRELDSVLIICPKALVAERKWQVEMKRFDEHFIHLDGRLLRHCLKETQLEGQWPSQYSRSILPFSLFDSSLVFGQKSPNSGHVGLLDLDPPPKFDLVIVDEAHHIRNSDTFLHKGIRHFCDNADAVLLLSATPVQLGSSDLFTLLNVLRPDLIVDPSSFEQMAQPNRFINTAIQHCRAAKSDWLNECRDALQSAADTEWGRHFLREKPDFQDAFDLCTADAVSDIDRIGLIRTLEELCTFSSLVNRTRRRDIGEFTTRKAQTESIPFTPDQAIIHDQLLQIIARILTYCHGHQSVTFMMTTIRRQAASCLFGLAPLLEDILAGKVDQLEQAETFNGEAEADTDSAFFASIRDDIDSLLKITRSIDPTDPKVDRFAQILQDKVKLPNNKALVFSTFRHTLAYLLRHSELAGLRCGLIHGDVADEDRATLRHRFALPKEDREAIDVLLSSEVGCEGLDFQFCDFLINYDLPWNPMRIEQRIGRIDRYGQNSKAIAIVNFLTPGTVDADIYQRCLARIGVFQHAIGGTEEILGEITADLLNIANRFELNPEERERQLQQLADNSINRIREEQELESQQSELFGLDVPSQSWRQEIAAAESQWLSPVAIESCVRAYLFSLLGASGDPILGSGPMKTLRLAQDARSKLLEDRTPPLRNIDPVQRAWESWLKGSTPTLPITFDFAAAADDPKVVFVSITHPLVRQAALHFRVVAPAHICLNAHSTEVPAGTHYFALYRWRMTGVKTDEQLVPIASNTNLAGQLLCLLSTATDTVSSQPPSKADLDALDVEHHSMWRTAQANHIARTRELIEHRIQSLSTSHRARSRILQLQISQATNDKIRLMRQSELGRIEVDFDRRIAQLEKEAGSGDIHSTPVLFGTLTINH
jgi:ATP-dependent helicase HepA